MPGSFFLIDGDWWGINRRQHSKPAASWYRQGLVNVRGGKSFSVHSPASCISEAFDHLGQWGWPPSTWGSCNSTVVGHLFFSVSDKWRGSWGQQLPLGASASYTVLACSCYYQRDKVVASDGSLSQVQTMLLRGSGEENTGKPGPWKELGGDNQGRKAVGFGLPPVAQRGC